jgi:hypothetical protein
MTGKGGGAHASEELLARYAAGDPGISPDVLWALEAHLESCAACRGGLVVDTGTAALLDRVRDGVATGVATAPTPARRRWFPRSARWMAPTLLRWLAMTGFALVAAVLLDVAAQATDRPGPPLVLLLAPVVPLLGIAAAWARAADPAYELVAATPRAGLYLLLRRTLAVLVVVIPVLAAAGTLVGASPARWLLPCLAFTAATLALGAVVGVPRAAAGLGIAWAVAVVGPSLVTDRMPLVLQPAAAPAWAAVIAAVLLAVALQRNAYTRLPSGR